MVVSQFHRALEWLCSEAADENDEPFFNKGWNVNIIKCEVAYSSILGMVSSPFPPCTLLWRPAGALLWVSASFFTILFFKIIIKIQKTDGWITVVELLRWLRGLWLSFLFFLKEDQIIFQIMGSIVEHQSILTKDSKPASLSSFLSLLPFLC